MKRSKRLYALLGILAAACIATFAVTRMEEKKEQIKATGEIILELPADTVTSLSWEYGETALAFHRDGTWLYDGDEAFPVSEEKMRELLEPFGSFGASFIIEEVTDPGIYGLDEPVCTIKLETEEQTYEVKLGDFSNMDGERYVSIGDGNVYLAKHDPLDEFDVVLRDMIDHDESLSYDQVSQIRFEGAEQYTITYAEEGGDSYCPDDVYFTEQKGKQVPLDTDRVGDYLEELVTVRLKDYETYNATPEELAACGLDDPQLIITVDYTKQDKDRNEIADTFVLSIGRDPEELAAGEEQSEDEKEETITAYARVGESQIVYRLDERDYTALMAASYHNLRHRQVLTADFRDVCQVDISLEGVDYTFAADGEDQDHERLWTYQGEEIEADNFEKALEGLSAGSSEDFTDEKPGGKVEISLTVYLDDENASEIAIGLYRYDGDFCLAVVDGQTFAKVSRGDAVKLIEAVNAIVLS